ncbi:hypothetical protein [Kutzneria buriramensis]|nr:hypothetical protein [Kutzneria buriramensis]
MYDGDRELLSLWWLEASSELTRAELAASPTVTSPNALPVRPAGQLDQD